MSRHRLTVVLSQAQGKHPARRALEEGLLGALLMEPGLEVSVVPHLYDLGPEHSGRLFLETIKGDMVLLSWLYPRAAFWVLDRDGIKGHEGQTVLKPANGDLDEETVPPRGIGTPGVPDRFIYCLDLRDSPGHQPFIDEVRRIAGECQQRYDAKQQLPGLVQLGAGKVNGQETRTFSGEQMLQPPPRRWYPVIDYGRCTNCMECIDFCLFGVYGIDSQERLVVENQDNCRKGCPACSRVCPEQAIMFPDFKTPAIAGAAVGSIDNLKIDLTALFGGDLKEALEQAVRERDSALLEQGRAAIGKLLDTAKRQDAAQLAAKDDLDKLMDSLDALDL